MASFMHDLLDIVFFLFDKTDNVIVIIPFAVLMWIVVLGLISRLLRRC